MFGRLSSKKAERGMREGQWGEIPADDPTVRTSKRPAWSFSQEAWDRSRVTIITAEGDLVDGYAIRTDAVLVKEPWLALPLVVAFGDERVSVTAIFESHGQDESTEWLALQLPALSIPAERVLPESDGASASSVAPQGRPLWCRLFPQLRGC